MAILSQVESSKNYRHHIEPCYFSVYHSGIENYVTSFLKLPYQFFIEETADCQNSKMVFDKFCLSNTPSIFFSFITYTCYYGNIASMLADYLSNRCLLNNFRIIEIKTCLQEAITNSVVHGNLNIGNNFRTVKDLYLQDSRIKEYLSIDEYKIRRINISIWQTGEYLKIAVGDEGCGFSISDYAANDALTNGRGLMLIRSLSDDMWVGEDKRTLFMLFNLA